MKSVIFWSVSWFLVIAGGIALIELYSPGTLWFRIACFTSGGLVGGFFCLQIIRAARRLNA